VIRDDAAAHNMCDTDKTQCCVHELQQPPLLAAKSNTPDSCAALKAPPTMRMLYLQRGRWGGKGAEGSK